MTFKIKDVRVYKNKRIIDSQIIPEAIIIGPNDAEFYSSGNTVQELDKKIYEEFGLGLEEEHVEKIVNEASFLAVFGE